VRPLMQGPPHVAALGVSNPCRATRILVVKVRVTVDFAAAIGWVFE